MQFHKTSSPAAGNLQTKHNKFSQSVDVLKSINIPPDDGAEQSCAVTQITKGVLFKAKRPMTNVRDGHQGDVAVTKILDGMIL